MKGFSAFLFFVAESVLLAAGIARAANGKGLGLLIVAVVVTGVLFVKLGCLDNAPKEDAHH